MGRRVWANANDASDCVDGKNDLNHCVGVKNGLNDYVGAKNGDCENACENATVVAPSRWDSWRTPVIVEGNVTVCDGERMNDA